MTTRDTLTELFPKLEQYLKLYNATQALFKGTQVAMPTNMEQAKPIFQALAGELSPENLTCDGELSKAHVDQKRRLFKGAWGELERIVGRVVTETETYSWSR